MPVSAGEFSFAGVLRAGLCPLKATVVKLKPHGLSHRQENLGFEPLHLFGTELVDADAFWGAGEGKGDG